MVKILDDDDFSGNNDADSAAQPALSGDNIHDQLVNAILSMPQPKMEMLVKKLMPYIVAFELRQPRVWGDSKKVILKNNIHINDLLCNTRSGTVTIEQDVFFGHRCKLLTGTHNYKKKGQERFKDVPDEGRDIHVKEGVWMGSGVTVLGPCVVGENAVIAAGSLVTVDEIPANTIWAGNPAKQVKEIDYE